ncbi:hypothetical protein FGO68_gene7854 [Halteria grandinella]|uniref:Arginase n=1 Tax=Halteria grandinella TaxID=5974 RepID=A0A8J8T017_HALGN|nr:hypothetical protein FGO68_gene7854 [Halteria grandinella]
MFSKLAIKTTGSTFFSQQTIRAFHRPVHIIGFPFAGGQQRPGPEEAPKWLFEQEWLHQMEKKGGVSKEMIQVTNQKCNQAQDKDILEGHRKGERNWNNVYESCDRLEKATAKSLLAKQYPVVFGGDHSQGIGSIMGMKQVWPQTRILWVDAHIDANTPQSTLTGDLHGGPVAYVAGLTQWGKKPVLSLKHLIYFGIRQWEPEEMVLIEQEKIPWYESKLCTVERLPQIKAEVEKYFYPDGKKQPYWISFDIDGVDYQQFASTGTPENQGIPLDFMLAFFDTFIPESVGMDLTEVNFLLSSGETTERDKRIVRQLIEKITDVVHREKPHYTLP